MREIPGGWKMRWDRVHVYWDKGNGAWSRVENRRCLSKKARTLRSWGGHRDMSSCSQSD